MTFEEDVFTLLSATLGSPASDWYDYFFGKRRIFPDFAPVSTPRPYVTFQQIGGQVLNPLGNESPGRRNSELQITVWSDTRAQALQLSRAIEDVMRGATTFTARPIAAAVADFDADIPVYGCRQDFSCWHFT